ncbi:MAG: DsbA family oxidoreductase [Sediminimonas qiaohouensis]|uniref:DsbA family oxidoreductase n=1 Tax=Sediminimonas qiaohouensis TaxID=552061 RepID=A0A7C9LMV3_9RHOB|nr:DsbA family oxidoreductase [Sediminimonas qiaohouensis]MTJ04282.1 DsbA family oxidoreductase [Sediminimonas qiaohouensis]
MATPIQIDIVSDVMCPWCIIGWKQLEHALTASGQEAVLRWHPFELNPDMPETGQNLREHLIGKYGITAQQSADNRERMQALGADLGFTFNFSEDMRMVNSFRAHQVIDWAGTLGHQHPMKMALFTAHFTQGRDVNDPAVLAEVAGEIGLDPAAARAVLDTARHAESVREKQRFWTAQGVSGVPAMVFQQQFLVTGAQGSKTYRELLDRFANADA